MLQTAEISYTAAPGGVALADERRVDERVRFPLEVRWKGLSGGCAARVYDISLSGCYIETLGDVQTGERVSFEIQSPTGRWLLFEGRVVHHQRNMGIPAYRGVGAPSARNVRSRPHNAPRVFRMFGCDAATTPRAGSSLHCRTGLRCGKERLDP